MNQTTETTKNKEPSRTAEMLSLLASIGARGHLPKESREELNQLWNHVMKLRNLNLPVVRHYIVESFNDIDKAVARGHLPESSKAELLKANAFLSEIDNHFKNNGVDSTNGGLKGPHIGWFCRECHDHICLTIHSGPLKNDYLPIKPTMCRFAGAEVTKKKGSFPSRFVDDKSWRDYLVKWEKYHGEGFLVAPERVVPKKAGPGRK